MTVNELLSALTTYSFIGLGVLTLVDYARHRDEVRLSIALMFNSLAIPLLIGRLMASAQVTAPWLTTLIIVLILAQPYLLLRIVEHFRHVPTAMRRFGFIGMVVAWAIAVATAPSLPRPLTLVIIVYFVVVNGYAMTVFVRGALTAVGVVRQRLRFAAIGTGLLALSILLSGVRTILPSLEPLTAPIGQLAAILCAWSFYLGFAPPRWLRWTWQLAELRQFLLQNAEKLSHKGSAHTLDRLCQAATEAVGGVTAAVALWDVAEGHLTLQPPGQYPSLSGALSAKDGIIGRAWQERQPLIAETRAHLGADDRRILEGVGAKVMLAIPIVAPGHAWGLLLVFIRHSSLFPEDDLSLLTLFAEQSAIILENNALLAEHRDLLEQVSRHAQQLEVANKELEAFSYSVSHDLRAPLRAVDGFSRILLQDYAQQLPPDAVRYLEIVRNNTRQMGELIDDLLTFSRLGRQPLNEQQVALTQLVKQVLEELRDEQAGRQVEIVIGDLPTWKADPVLLKQVFANLLSNALKFSRKREVARIEIGCQAMNGEKVCFVKDNGAGFDMQYANKLFGVFQRLHRSEDYDGTGVGLALAQRILQRHGGRIWAEGEVDKGATFYLTLGDNVVEPEVQPASVTPA